MIARCSLPSCNRSGCTWVMYCSPHITLRNASDLSCVRHRSTIAMRSWVSSCEKTSVTLRPMISVVGVCSSRWRLRSTAGDCARIVPSSVTTLNMTPLSTRAAREIEPPDNRETFNTEVLRVRVTLARRAPAQIATRGDTSSHAGKGNLFTTTWYPNTVT